MDELTTLVQQAVAQGKITGVVVGYTFFEGETQKGPVKPVAQARTKPIVFEEGEQAEEQLQEDQIEVESTLNFVGGLVRHTAAVVNKSPAPITQVNLKVDFPPHLALLRVTPEFPDTKPSEKYFRVKVPEVPARSKQELNAYFVPNRVGAIEIRTSIQFVNAKNLVRVLKVPSVSQVTFNCPTFMQTGLLSAEAAQERMQQLPERAVRSFGIPPNLAGQPQVAFVHVKQLVKSLGLAQVGERESADARVAWFAGHDAETNNEFIVIGQVINGKMEFFASSDEAACVTGLLTHLSRKIRARMVSSRILASEDALVALMCPKCGGSLPNFPADGERLTCKWCQHEFTFQHGQY